MSAYLTTVLKKNIIGDILPEGQPVFSQLFRADDQDLLVAQLIIFDDPRAPKVFPGPHLSIRMQPVVFFQFVDATDNVSFKIIEAPPYFCFLKTSGFVGQQVFVNVIRAYSFLRRISNSSEYLLVPFYPFLYHFTFLKRKNKFTIQISINP